MVQRKQSLFLLIAALLMISLYMLPVAEILSNNGQIYVFSSKGLFVETSEVELFFKTIPTLIMLSAICLISVVTIFMFKNRIRQMRLNFFNILIMLGYLGLNYFYLYSFNKQLNGVITYKLPAVIPLLAIIFTYMAIRSIGQDEALVRSVDRIR